MSNKDELTNDMELISTHVCKVSDVGFHGNLFGGQMLAWLDEAAAAYVCQMCDSPQMVTVKVDTVHFKLPVRPHQIIKIYGRLKGIRTTTATVELEARRHSPYNGSQKNCLYDYNDFLSNRRRRITCSNW